ncbi:hypothetical protein Dsin_002492 [Dipteronia sinensis]|uniref:Endonuclease/exonuclease/phosphatase domain-containing protein n=1 Tax=Dipteronia sinensis TaxID=43782 RepID=A0AAE0B6A6_9ROSI|nr:hypothetical protein Dsin_002492 [Dipteronia sinensis]
MDPEVMFLMEMKLGVQALERIRIKLGYLGKLVMESVGRSGGLCLFWSYRICADLISFSRFHIDVRITFNESKLWRLIGFYGSPDSTQRGHTWMLLRRLRSMSSLPWLRIGDFNEVLNSYEKHRETHRQWRLIEEFRETVDDCELMDMGFRGLGFTLSNRRDGSALVQERPILVEILTASDQYPVVGERLRWRFHFEACWANCEECHALVRSSWTHSVEGGVVRRVVAAISNCGQQLAGVAYSEDVDIVLNSLKPRLSPQSCIFLKCLLHQKKICEQSSIWHHLRHQDLRDYRPYSSNNIGLRSEIASQRQV